MTDHAPSPPADVHVESSDPRCPVVTIRGEVDGANAHHMTTALTTAAAHRPTGLVADLTAVTFFGSAGLSALLSTADHALRHDIRFAAVCSAPVLRVLDLTGTLPLIETHPTTPAARAALLGP